MASQADIDLLKQHIASLSGDKKAEATAKFNQQFPGQSVSVSSPSPSGGGGSTGTSGGGGGGGGGSSAAKALSQVVSPPEGTVGARSYLEGKGVDVGWDQATQSIIASYGGKSQVFKPAANIQTGDTWTSYADPNSMNALMAALGVPGYPNQVQQVVQPSQVQSAINTAAGYSPENPFPVGQLRYSDPAFLTPLVNQIYGMMSEANQEAKDELLKQTQEAKKAKMEELFARGVGHGDINQDVLDQMDEDYLKNVRYMNQQTAASALAQALGFGQLGLQEIGQQYGMFSGDRAFQAGQNWNNVNALMGLLGNQQQQQNIEFNQQLALKNQEITENMNKLNAALARVGEFGKVTTEEDAAVLGVPVGTESFAAQQAAEARKIEMAMARVNAFGKVTTEEDAKILGVPVGTLSWQAQNAADERAYQLQKAASSASSTKQSDADIIKENTAAAQKEIADMIAAGVSAQDIEKRIYQNAYQYTMEGVDIKELVDYTWKAMTGHPKPKPEEETSGNTYTLPKEW